MHDPRHIALMVLLENEKKKITLDQSLAKFSKKLDNLSKRDRTLANAIIYGTLRWRGHLDWIIISFSSRRIDRINPEILYLIRMALYQIIHMDRIPVSAAVNSAVTIAKRVAGKPAAGFVNALLRKAGNNYLEVTMPDLKKDPAMFISATKSFPLWLSKIWIKIFGFEKSLKLCDAINQIPPITVRANSLKTDRKALAALIENFAEHVTLTEHAENGISFTRPAMPIAEMQAFKDGLFQVQDEAAQLITSILDPKPCENILDACAGLGGKTGHAGQLMKNQGTLTAWDINKSKLSSLESEMKRVGITIVKTKQMDLLETTKSEYHNSFDRVLVDAPCTGLGVLRRNPDSKWSRCKNDITRLAQIQSCMLLNAAELVKPGGTLVYAVCSCHPLENEEIIIPFLKKRDDFFINKNIPCLEKFSNRGKDEFYNTGMDKLSNTNLNKLYNKGMISDNGFFRTYPDNLFMDGFFAVSMQRKK